LKVTRKAGFDARIFPESAGNARRIVKYRRDEVIFTQGDPCDHVLYIQTGNIKLSVLSTSGREAVVAMLGAGEFLGEGCLAGQAVRMGTATATSDSSALIVDKERMVRMLHAKHALSDRFIAHMLARNIRIEEDLIDQLFNSSESAWPGRCCSWRDTANTTSPYGPCRPSPRARWRKWSARRDRG
jgi:CRP/FNR family transcriptional regulator, cyclic AMP receptor protein